MQTYELKTLAETTNWKKHLTITSTLLLLEMQELLSQTSPQSEKYAPKAARGYKAAISTAAPSFYEDPLFS